VDGLSKKREEQVAVEKGGDQRRGGSGTGGISYNEEVRVNQLISQSVKQENQK
jgi:hypothetical protein